MPIDYIKCQININKVKDIEEHPLLEFHTLLNERTGELSKTKEARFNGLVFTIRLHRLWLSGSLHYFYNDGIHNYNDFSFYRLFDTLNMISRLFGIDLSKCKLENIEFGVNVSLPFKTSTLLNNMLFHEVQKFKDEKVKKGKGDYRVATHDRYMLKSYDKRLQFSTSYNIWRFEIHYNRMADLKKFGVIYLNDLKDLRKLMSLNNILLKKFDEVFVYDWTINEDEIEKPPNDLNKMRLPHFWIEALNKSNRHKRKKIYDQLVNRYSSDVKRTIRNLIEKKASELLESKKRPFHNRKIDSEEATISQFSYSVN